MIQKSASQQLEIDLDLSGIKERKEDTSKERDEKIKTERKDRNEYTERKLWGKKAEERKGKE